MATQRYISTSFWDDEWIQTLDPSEKFLFLYFMTNPLTNIAGVYKIAVRRICFDTGFTSDTVGHIMAKFEKARKAFRLGEYIALPSWPKHQKWETKESIKEGIDIILKELPDEIRDKLCTIGYCYPIIPPSSPHRPTYSDLDSDIDTDSDKDTDKDSKDGFTRIELARAIWNEVMPRKPYRYTALNMGDQVRSECLRPMAVYRDEEIEEAIRNYARILESPEHEIKSPYESFHGFMRSGVEKFVQEADPWTAYKKRSKGFETAAEREERERAEAIERIGKMGA